MSSLAADAATAAADVDAVADVDAGADACCQGCSCLFQNLRTLDKRMGLY